MREGGSIGYNTLVGTAHRAGLGAKARRAQNRSAARLGQRSGWEH